MKKSHHLHREYETYEVFETDEFLNSVDESYNRLSKGEETGRYPEGYADKWHGLLYDYLESLENPDMGSIGKIDPEFYSAKYAYTQVPNTKSTLCFLVEEDRIFLGVVDRARANWKGILEENEEKIDKAIDKLKAQKKAEKSEVRGKEILPPSERSSKEQKSLKEKQNKPPARSKPQDQEK